jgi:predicted dehydrogenase
MAGVPPPRAPRVAVVGARQARNGVGAWLARHLAAAGAEIAAVVGSRLATAGAAADALAETLSYRPLPLAHADDVARLPDLDALVVCSPATTHEAWLQWAAGRRLHVLCEKPLVWGGHDAAEAAEALAERFVDRGLHLVVNAQWPHALPAIAALHPALDLGAVSRMRARLAPPSRGPDMVPDSVPHVLSLLYALAPDPEARLEGVTAAWEEEEGRALALRFSYLAAGRRIDVTVDLAQGGASPRAFALTLDGRSAVREVAADGYAMRLVDGSRHVPLPDPMAALAAAFLARLRAGSPAVDPSAFPGVRHLVEVAAALPALAVPEIPYP